MKKKVAVVIGGTGGIGQEVCKSIAKDGYFVYIGCRDSAKGQYVLEQLEGNGGSGALLQFDITSRQEVQDAVQSLKEEKVDLLVNNAGVLRDDIIFNISREDWKLVYETNFEASLAIYKELETKLMKAPSPKVIMMCSISGVRARMGQLSYGVTKSMLIKWVESIAKINQKISYYAISPGPVETELIKNSKWYQDKKSVKRIPLARYAKPEEIADFVVLLGKSPNLFQSGSNLIIDGGFLQTTKE